MVAGIELNMSPTKILVVDDHSIIRHGIASLLAEEEDLCICGEANDYDEGLSACQTLHPDVMLVDITLKDKSGLELIRDARAQGYTGKILVLSMHAEATHAEKALRAGAQGYVMKEDADDILSEAIRKVLRGEVFFSADITSRMLQQQFSVEQEEGPNTGIGALTERELEIFECLGHGLSSKEIAEKFALSKRTVEVHRAHIKKKLQCESSAQLLREAFRWVEE
ncbi:MAG: response regulator transcription factor [Spartobacteria bacterium]|nr:response regulator transcription factor [Spartobacteria bacterium]